MDLSNFKFPFPQIHLGSSTFLLFEDKIDLVSNDTFEVLESVTVTAGDAWHVADFGAFVVFTNSAQVVIFDPVSGFAEAPNLPLFQTCCAFNGQLFAGAFVPPAAQ